MKNGRKLEGLNSKTSSKRLGLMLVKTGIRAGIEERVSMLDRVRKPVASIKG
jgi:hypothetical protein